MSGRGGRPRDRSPYGGGGSRRGDHDRAPPRGPAGRGGGGGGRRDERSRSPPRRDRDSRRDRDRDYDRDRRPDDRRRDDRDRDRDRDWRRSRSRSPPRRPRDRSQDRDGDDDRRRDSQRDRASPPPPRDRERNRARSPAARDSRRPSPPARDHQKMDVEEGEGEAGGDVAEDDDAAMMAMMGFGGFDSTKGKEVQGNQTGAAKVNKARTWRQYMNRRGGFNRPLDKIK